MDQMIYTAAAAASAALLTTLDVEWNESEHSPSQWPLILRKVADPGDASRLTCRAVLDQAAEEAAEHLAEFVRAFPGEANIEALYRHARSCGVHDRPSDGFDDVPAAFRIAYAVFRATLIEADKVFVEEERRAAVKAAADRPQPPVLVNAEDTILEQHGSIFEKVGDRPAQVNLGGPKPAETEGEGGDAAAQTKGAGSAPVAEMEAGGMAASTDAAVSAASAVPAADAVGETSSEAPPDPANDSPGAPPAAAVPGGEDDEGGSPTVSGAGEAGASADGHDAVLQPRAPEAPSADALEAKAKALSPARKKR